MNDICDILAEKISDYLTNRWGVHMRENDQNEVSAIIRDTIPHYMKRFRQCGKTETTTALLEFENYQSLLEEYKDLKERHEKALDLLAKADEILFSNSDVVDEWVRDCTSLYEMKIEQIKRRHKEQLKLIPEFEALVEKKTGMTIEQIKDLPMSEFLERTKND